jgi:RNA polymerase sigma factor (TIGR02999 family)
MKVQAMTKVTQILSQIGQGDPSAAEQLLPLVYDELRRLAAAKLAREKPGQTLQPTALVHEAYIRLVDTEKAQHWDSRGHFFSAAAEAMRRILVETARAKKRHRRGGNIRRCNLLETDVSMEPDLDGMLDLDAALTKLALADAQAGKLVELRVFAGMTLNEVAEHLGISTYQAKRTWTYARVWLRREIAQCGSEQGGQGHGGSAS